MKKLINKNLITLKCVLFCFLSGIGCIFPFLPMHMLSVGLERGEARLISAVAPCVAILGPAVLGCLIDKLSVGRGSTGGAPGPSGSGRLLRVVTAVCLILSALFYTLLLAVPYTERHEARRPQVLFMCDADSAYVMQEVCKEDMRCNRWSGVKSGVLAVGSCEYGCADENMTWVRQPFLTTSTTTTLSPMYNSVANSTAPTINFTSYDEDDEDFEVHPPHLCYKGQCQVYMQHASRMRVPLSLVAPDPPEDNSTADADWCTYRTSEYRNHQQTSLSHLIKTRINFTSYDEDDEDFEVHPPHLCYKGQCQVYMQHASRMRVPLSLVAPDPPEDNSTADADWCTYRTNGPSCIVPSDRLPPGAAEGSCKPAVRCQVLDPYDEPDAVLADAECRLTRGDPTYTFTVYLILRMLADIWPTAALALLGAACVIATRETSLGRGDVGRQLAFGTLGLAIFPPLAGLAAENMPEAPYVVPFVMHAVFMLIGAVILLFDRHMPLSAPEWWWHTSTGVLALPMSAVRRYGAETAAVFAVVALLGTLWSGIDAYLPWMVADLNGTISAVGLTLTAGALPAVPALWWAEALVDYVGHSNVFITAFTFYCVRYTGLAYSTDYSWIIVCEILEVFTLSLVWVTAVLYFRHLVPRQYTATGQALPVIAHFCIGRCIGAIIGGLVSLETPLESTRTLHRALGVTSLIAAAVYLALYHLLLAPRCAARPQPPPSHLLQGLNANGGSNGTYSPMRVYHEERSRKGHFRY